MIDRFREGEVYFRVTYPDSNMHYPRIESFVFVGKSLSDEDTEETWYFQFVDSFAQYGSILEGPRGDRRVSCVNLSDLDDMLDDEGLLKELSAARSRRLSNRSK
ncbi:MAG: hypothetical protein JSR66_34060 [Proteobacteria bacterium]|nr:hypothetical protein [Pseudomonadota bacterium]